MTTKRLSIVNFPKCPRIHPGLAQEIGLNESLILLQVEYYIAASGREINGERWVHESVSDLRKDFPFMGRATVQRAIQRLITEPNGAGTGGLGLLRAGTFNARPNDKTRWFAIHWERCSKLRWLNVKEDAAPPCPEPFRNGTACSKMEQPSRSEMEQPCSEMEQQDIISPIVLPEDREGASAPRPPVDNPVENPGSKDEEHRKQVQVRNWLARMYRLCHGHDLAGFDPEDRRMSVQDRQAAAAILRMVSAAKRREPGGVSRTDLTNRTLNALVGNYYQIHPPRNLAELVYVLPNCVASQLRPAEKRRPLPAVKVAGKPLPTDPDVIDLKADEELARRERESRNRSYDPRKSLTPIAETVGKLVPAADA